MARHDTSRARFGPGKDTVPYLSQRVYYVMGRNAISLSTRSALVYVLSLIGASSAVWGLSHFIHVVPLFVLTILLGPVLLMTGGSAVQRRRRGDRTHDIYWVDRHAKQVTDWMQSKESKAIETGGATSVRRRNAVERIQSIEADHERRMLDIVEAIEHSALFSMRFAPTADFEQARIELRDTGINEMSDDELTAAAARLQRLWDAAVANAEHLGLSALRDPKLGGTAIKLLKTAGDERTPAAERELARTKLTQALRELGLPVEPRVLDALVTRELTV